MDLVLEGYGLLVDGVRGSVEGILTAVPDTVAIRFRVVLNLNEPPNSALRNPPSDLVQKLQGLTV